MTWLGIRANTTPVDETPGVSEIQYNTRMRVANELQRRWGYQSSSIAKQDGPILGIVSANGAGGNYLTFDLGSPAAGTVTGFSPPPAQPPGPKRRKPVVVAGTPAPPVINFIANTPASPKAYQAGIITFTPDITYDGLSGPLLYNWQQTVGPAAPNPSFSAAAIYAPDFDGFCIPGLYSFTLTIDTTLNGFTNGPFPFNFTVS